MIATPLVTTSQVIITSKVPTSPAVISEVNSIVVEVDGVLRSYVGNRYDINQFTDANLILWPIEAKWLAMLRSIALMACVGRLLMSTYGIQMLKEDMNWNYLYEQQIAKLKEIWQWVIRLLDINNQEMPLVPLPNKSNSAPKSTMKNPCRDFTRWQRR